MREDEELIELFRARAETAVEETSEKYGTYCRSIALRVLRNEQDVEECVNETYWRVWNMIPPCSPPNFRTFLGRTVRRVAFDMYDTHAAQKRGGIHAREYEEELSESAPSKWDVETAVDELALQDTIEHFLSTLKKKERWIFLRRYWYLDSIADIAQQLEQSESSVKMSLCRTRKKLKATLEKEGIVF
ncbi:MAG: RNA polymerase sigma factor [Clostridia bacterium]|nr:RNA polymerase sigma factor [Clostridia bacterium]